MFARVATRHLLIACIKIKPFANQHLFIKFPIARNTTYIKPLPKIIVIHNDIGFYPRTLGRIIYLACLYVPLICTYPLSYLSFLRQWWIKYLLWTVEHSGPTFIKLGQWASSRVDLFPPEYCSILSKLQENARPHSIYHTRRVIIENLGCEIEEIFESFNPEPVGVGAVAQVYRARLRHEHRDVAVKVLHPNAQQTIEIDLKLMYAVSRVIELVVPDAKWLSLPDEVSVFAEMMHQQLDLRNEAANLRLFKANFDGWTLVGFPTPILDSSQILIESWIPGISLEKFLRLGRSCCDKTIATIGLSSFLKMLLLDNHVHADLHPGNIMISYQKIPQNIRDPIEFIPTERLDELRAINDPQEWQSFQQDIFDDNYIPYLYYIDAGLISKLSQLNLTNFIDLFKAITNFDGTEISHLMVTRSKTPTTVVDYKGFSETMQKFMENIKLTTLALGNIQVSDILSFVLTNVRKHHIKIDGDFANVVVSIFLLEGIGRQLDSKVDLLRAAVPFLTEAVQVRLKGNISNTETTVWRAIEERLHSKLFKNTIFK